ncbi:hypothetical protein [Alkalimarinus sediminis]|uniref:Uncharacterized protein n=1 Tax=Alkalimarinus sediminis TaxID=1632866 RepID=A0A9E8KJZ4_9ALTE|nr:hypothetical protein [Alkalimarinus sediminis]UZW75561.1 hypothetical protein NNL22_02915 [Alkalimarinus sediminis]
MDINNAIIPVTINRPQPEGVNPRLPQSNELSGEVARERRSDRVNRDTIDPAELQRRVEQKQATQAIDVTRSQSPESLPLNTQQALNTYQQTEVAAQEFEGGVLVGIDLFA